MRRGVTTWRAVAALALLVGLLPLLARPAGATAPAAPACSVTWTAPTGGDWSTAADWDAGHVPASSDVACIPASTTGTVTITTAQTVGALESTGGTLQVTSRLTLDDGSTSSTITGLWLDNGTLDGASPLALAGSSRWDAGTLAGGPLTIPTGATLTDRACGTDSLARPTTIDGTFVYRQVGASQGCTSSLLIPIGTTVTVSKAGTFDLDSQGAVTSAGSEGGGTLVVHGLLERTGTGQSTFFLDSLVTDGTIAAPSATLLLGGPLDLQDPTVTAGSDVELYEASFPTGIQRFEGTLVAIAGTMPSSLLIPTGAALVDPECDKVTFEGTEVAGTLRMRNDSSCSSSSLATLADGAVLQVDDSGVIDLVGSRTGIATGPAGTSSIALHGTMTRSGGTGASLILPRVQATGTITTTAGSIELTSGAELAGVTVGPGSDVVFAGLAGADPQTFHGTITWLAGALAGTSTLDVPIDATLIADGCSGASVAMPTTVHGTLQVGSSDGACPDHTIAVRDGTTLTVALGGRLVAGVSGARVNEDGNAGTAAVDNRGTISTPTATSLAFGTVPTSNEGTEQVTGPLDLLDGTDLSAGTLGGGTYDLAGPLTFAPATPLTTLAGTLVLRPGGSLGVGSNAHAERAVTSIASGGALRLEGVELPTTSTVDLQGTLAGAGSVGAAVVLDGGTVAPSGGQLGVGGLTGTGRLDLPVDPSAPTAPLASSGATDLSSTTVVAAATSVLTPGASYPAVACTCGGALPAVTGPVTVSYAPPGLVATAFSATKISTSVKADAGPVVAASPDAPTTYRFTSTVRDLGPAGADRLMLQETVPVGSTVVSLPSTCSLGGTTITCTLAPLRKGATASVAITLSSFQPGSASTTVTVVANDVTQPSASAAKRVVAASGTSYLAIADPAIAKNVKTSIGRRLQVTNETASTRRLTSEDGLLDTGDLLPGQTVDVALDEAGSFTVSSGSTKAKITVDPFTLPISGGAHLVWSNGPVPTGFVYDVRVRTGSSTRTISHGTPSSGTDDTAEAPGSHTLLVRLRNVSTGVATGDASVAFTT